MNELQKKVIEEMELNHGWSNMVDDESIGMKLFKDTVTATEKVVKNLTLADVMPRFIPIESCMKCPNNYEFTHLWVDGFGWENTILLPSDFDKVLKMPIKDKDGSLLFMGYNFDEENQKVEIRKFKGNYHGLT